MKQVWVNCSTASCTFATTRGFELPTVVTAIPGPKSVEMQKRRVEVVSAGVSSTLPVYVKRAGGGIVEDIDGNSFIDLASGIAVTMRRFCSRVGPPTTLLDMLLLCLISYRKITRN